MQWEDTLDMQYLFYPIPRRKIAREREARIHRIEQDRIDQPCIQWDTFELGNHIAPDTQRGL